MVVGTKADIAVADWPGLRISAVTGEGVRELVGRMATLVHEARSEQPVDAGHRHHPPGGRGWSRRATRRARVPSGRSAGRAGRRAQRRDDARGAVVHRLPDEATRGAAGSWPAPARRTATSSGSPSSASSTSRRPDAAGGQDRHVVDHRRARGDRRRTVVDTLCDQLAALRAAGHEVILVSSGAVSAGVAALGMSARPTDMPTLQAISAAGQSRLMGTYNRSLARHRSGRRAGAAGAQRLRRSPPVSARPPDAAALDRARLHPDHQRERRDRQPRTALRRQRSHRRARRPQRQRRSAGAADRHAGVVHRRSRAPTRTPS